ncbi:MAG: hypothetical protein WC375_00225 [Methanomassiliicoccales archaeon]|jgi:hypothetical protein
MGMKDYKTILDDITCDNCDGTYCILKQILLHTHHPDARIMIQIKCVDKFKYEESEKAKKDIGWEDAFNRWVDKGYASAFAEAYNEDLSVAKVYKATVDIVRNRLQTK